MSNYAIMRIEKRKLGSVSRICNHHERLKQEYKSNPDIDFEKTDYNFHIKMPEGKYRDVALNMINEAGAKRRKDSIIMQDALVTASPDWMKTKTYEEQKEYFEYAYEFFTKTFGEKNMISAVVHVDESNPHMHICFVPLTKDNRLSSKEIIGGPKGLEQLQDKFYEHMHERFPDLSRGISRRITHRKHLPPYIFKNAEMLYSHYEEIVKAVNDIGMLNNSKKREAAIEMLGKYAPEMAELKTQVKRTDNYISDLEKAIKKMDNKLEDKKIEVIEKNYELDEKEKDIYKLKDEIRILNNKQNKLQKLIDKIPPQVLDEMKRDERKRRERER